MKAITIHQPWASLIACGAKRYETRSWSTNYRGKIAIHAGLKPVLPGFQDVEKDVRLKIIEVLARHKMKVLNALPCGYIIATAELVECWQVHGAGGRGATKKDVFIDKYNPGDDDGVTMIEGDEYVFGNYFPGRYAWELANVKMLDKPIPARGRQRLWDWDESEGNVNGQ